MKVLLSIILTIYDELYICAHLQLREFIEFPIANSLTMVLILKLISSNQLATVSVIETNRNFLPT
jgi:hypothetical protein